MKLLFDENLPRSLVRSLNDLFPGSNHVVLAGLQSASDDEVWDFAMREGLAIVSKDTDFQERSGVRGHPPKIVWVRRGNCTTLEIAALLRGACAELLEFEYNAASVLVLE